MFTYGKPEKRKRTLLRLLSLSWLLPFRDFEFMILIHDILNWIDAGIPDLSNHFRASFQAAVRHRIAEIFDSMHFLPFLAKGLYG